MLYSNHFVTCIILSYTLNIYIFFFKKKAKWRRSCNYLGRRYCRLAITSWNRDKGYRGFLITNYPHVSLVPHSKLLFYFPSQSPQQVPWSRPSIYLFLLTGPESLWSSDTVRSVARCHWCHLLLLIKIMSEVLLLKEKVVINISCLFLCFKCFDLQRIPRWEQSSLIAEEQEPSSLSGNIKISKGTVSKV